MNLKVDKDKCIGCGQCVSLCEEIFDFDDDGLAKTIKNSVPDNINEEAKIALESCPTGAIIEE